MDAQVVPRLVLMEYDSRILALLASKSQIYKSFSLKLFYRIFIAKVEVKFEGNSRELIYKPYSS
jgi:hypothetical protein